MTDEVVTRLHRAIVEALRQRGSPEGPVKVADLYQELVPYRAVRSTLGVELNADYEHALLRLLAGERGLLRLEPEAARAELRKEAAQPHPSVGLYRKFAGSDVWITLPDAADPGDSSGPSETATSETATPETCPACGFELPTGRNARYCPGCGADQRLRPCPGCGELLEAEWRFCIACGRETDA